MIKISVSYNSRFRENRLFPFLMEEAVKNDQVYITKEEKVRCQKVADAFAEMYDEEDIVVVNAGKYGFVKLQFYAPPVGFGAITTFTDSKSLFDDLWEEWLETRLLRWAYGTPIADLDNEDIFRCLPKEKQKQFLDKQLYFAEKAGMKKESPGEDTLLSGK